VAPFQLHRSGLVYLGKAFQEEFESHLKLLLQAFPTGGYTFKQMLPGGEKWRNWPKVEAPPGPVEAISAGRRDWDQQPQKKL
jgi:hypothetical protein